MEPPLKRARVAKSVKPFDSDEWKRFLGWLHREGGDVSAVLFAESDEGDRGIFAKRSLEKGETLLKIPSRLAVTPVSARKSAEIRAVVENAGIEIDARDCLYLHLMYQRATPSAFWHAYMHVIPKEYTDPLWWTPAELALLDGTNLQAVVPQRRVDLRERFDRLFPLLSEKVPEFFGDYEYTFEDYVWAHSSLCSRGFPLQLVHGDSVPDLHLMKDKFGSLGALVPGMDMGNHRYREPVQWAYNPAVWVGIECARDYHKHEEVCNNYGAKSNEQLLLGYGFALEDNRHSEWRFSLRVSDHLDQRLRRFDLEKRTFYVPLEVAEAALEDLEATLTVCALSDQQVPLVTHTVSDTATGDTDHSTATGSDHSTVKTVGFATTPEKRVSLHNAPLSARLSGLSQALAVVATKFAMFGRVTPDYAHKDVRPFIGMCAKRYRESQRQAMRAAERHFLCRMRTLWQEVHKLQVREASPIDETVSLSIDSTGRVCTSSEGVLTLDKALLLTEADLRKKAPKMAAIVDAYADSLEEDTRLALLLCALDTTENVWYKSVLESTEKHAQSDAVTSLVLREDAPDFGALTQSLPLFAPFFGSLEEQRQVLESVHQLLLLSAETAQVSLRQWLLTWHLTACNSVQIALADDTGVQSCIAMLPGLVTPHRNALCVKNGMSGTVQYYAAPSVCNGAIVRPFNDTDEFEAFVACPFAELPFPLPDQDRLALSTKNADALSEHGRALLQQVVAQSEMCQYQGNDSVLCRLQIRAQKMRRFASSFVQAVSSGPE